MSDESIFTKEFWAAACERAVKTWAQTLGAVLAANGLGLLATDWGAVLSVAGMAGMVSLLTSIGSGVVTGDGPSLSRESLE